MNLKKVIFILALFFQTFLLKAQEQPEQFDFNSDVKPDLEEITCKEKPSKNLRLGANLVGYRYVEGGLISHSGGLVGIHGDWSWTLWGSVRGLLSGEGIFGQLTYDGSLCETSTGNCAPYTAKTNDLIMRWTHRFVFSMSSQLELFIGPGFRYLFDKGIGAGFYSRAGTYFYVPMGLTYWMPDWNLFIDAEYDIFLQGKMRSKLSDVNTTFADVVHTQSSGWGHRITIGREYSETYVALYYESWQIADSNVEPLFVNGVNSGVYFIEPKNFTDSIGLKMGLKF